MKQEDSSKLLQLLLQLVEEEQNYKELFTTQLKKLEDEYYRTPQEQRSYYKISEFYRRQRRPSNANIHDALRIVSRLTAIMARGSH
jgi:hypothetical protein